MEIEHIYPQYDKPEERIRAMQELNAHLSVKLYNKRRLEKKQQRKGDDVDDS